MILRVVTVEAVLAVIGKINCLNILQLSPLTSNKLSLPSFFFHGFENKLFYYTKRLKGSLSPLYVCYKYIRTDSVNLEKQ